MNTQITDDDDRVSAQSPSKVPLFRWQPFLTNSATIRREEAYQISQESNKILKSQASFPLAGNHAK